MVQTWAYRPVDVGDDAERGPAKRGQQGRSRLRCAGRGRGLARGEERVRREAPVETRIRARADWKAGTAS